MSKRGNSLFVEENGITLKIEEFLSRKQENQTKGTHYRSVKIKESETRTLKQGLNKKPAKVVPGSMRKTFLGNMQPVLKKKYNN